MLIICNEKEAGKKIFKKIQKVIISENITINDERYETELNQFMPTPNTFFSYLDREISFKKFAKLYITNIRKSVDLYSTIVMFMYAYLKNEDMLLVSTDEEIKLGIIDLFASILVEDFEVEVTSYKKWKNKEVFGRCKINEKSLKRALKEYREVLMIDDHLPKKDNKKKKKKNDFITSRLSGLEKRKKVKLSKKEKKKLSKKNGYYTSTSINPKKEVVQDKVGYDEVTGYFIAPKMHIVRVTRLDK